jgi:hypothetical protein
MNRKSLVLVIFVIAFLSGCGGSQSGPPASISLVLSTPAPSNIAPDGTFMVSTTVLNDSANGGVAWNCTPVSDCGSFSPSSTASGIATTNTATVASCPSIATFWGNRKLSLLAKYRILSTLNFIRRQL